MWVAPRDRYATLWRGPTGDDHDEVGSHTTDDTMNVIHGTTHPRRRRSWWAQRPDLRLVRDPRAPQPPQVGEHTFFLAMIASFCLFVLTFARFIGAWTGG